MDTEKVTYKRFRSSYYLISTHGDVISLRGKTPKQIKTQTNKNGYKYVCIMINKKKIGIPIHRMIGESFIGNISGLEINHKDNDKLNNNLSNLEICTRSENASHMWKNKKTKRGIYKRNLKKESWVSQITYKGKHIYIGSFKSEELARNAYELKYKELRGTNV